MPISEKQRRLFDFKDHLIGLMKTKGAGFVKYDESQEAKKAKMIAKGDFGFDSNKEFLQILHDHGDLRWTKGDMKKLLAKIIDGDESRRKSLSKKEQVDWMETMSNRWFNIASKVKEQMRRNGGPAEWAMDLPWFEGWEKKTKLKKERQEGEEDEEEEEEEEEDDEEEEEDEEEEGEGKDLFNEEMDNMFEEAKREEEANEKDREWFKKMRGKLGDMTRQIKRIKENAEKEEKGKSEKEKKEKKAKEKKKEKTEKKDKAKKKEKKTNEKKKKKKKEKKEKERSDSSEEIEEPDEAKSPPNKRKRLTSKSPDPESETASKSEDDPKWEVIFSTELMMPLRYPKGVLNAKPEPGLVKTAGLEDGDWVIGRWPDGYEEELPIQVRDLKALWRGKEKDPEEGPIWTGMHSKTQHELTVDQRVDRSLLMILREQGRQICQIRVDLFGDLGQEHPERLPNSHSQIRRAAAWMIEHIVTIYQKGELERGQLTAHRKQMIKETLQKKTSADDESKIERGHDQETTCMRSDCRSEDRRSGDQKE